MTRAAASPKPKKKRRRGRRLLVLLVLAALVGGGIAALRWWRERSRDFRIAALVRRRDALRERLAALAAKDPVMAAAPAADVLLGIPERVGAELIGEIATGFLGETRVELNDLAVRKSGEVSAKTLFGRMTPGAYSIDLHIHEIRGVLAARAPKVSFEGQRIAVALPVRVTRGKGRATLLFRWDSHGLAGALCGDFQARVPLSGRVVPGTYVARGWFDVALAGQTLTAQPAFPDLKVNLRIEPSRETWEAVDKVLGERGAGCRAALKLVDVPALLRGILEKGFDVAVPQKLFEKPLELHAAWRREVTFAGRSYLVGSCRAPSPPPRASCGTAPTSHS